jgi:hypothetical protein
MIYRRSFWIFDKAPRRENAAARSDALVLRRSAQGLQPAPAAAGLLLIDAIVSHRW